MNVKYFLCRMSCVVQRVVYCVIVVFYFCIIFLVLYKSVLFSVLHEIAFIYFCF